MEEALPGAGERHVVGHSSTDASEIYRIAYDPDRNLLTATCRGFWSPEDIGPYRVAMGRFVRIGHTKHGMIRCLVDRRKCPAQVGEVVDLIREAVVASVRDSDCFALVVTSTLVKMQARRAFELKRIKVFEETEPAMAWLLGKD